MIPKDWVTHIGTEDGGVGIHFIAQIQLPAGETASRFCFVNTNYSITPYSAWPFIAIVYPDCQFLEYPCWTGPVAHIIPSVRA